MTQETSSSLDPVSGSAALGDSQRSTEKNASADDTARFVRYCFGVPEQQSETTDDEAPT
jgi:hypothetical protein